MPRRSKINVGFNIDLGARKEASAFEDIMKQNTSKETGKVDFDASIDTLMQLGYTDKAKGLQGVRAKKRERDNGIAGNAAVSLLQRVNQLKTDHNMSDPKQLAESMSVYSSWMRENLGKQGVLLPEIDAEKGWTPDFEAKLNHVAMRGMDVGQRQKMMEGARGKKQGLKVGSTKERLLDLTAQGKELTGGQKKAWKAIFSNDLELVKTSIQMITRNFETKYDPGSKQRKGVEDTLGWLRGMLGENEGETGGTAKDYGSAKGVKEKTIAENKEGQRIVVKDGRWVDAE